MNRADTVLVLPCNDDDDNDDENDDDKDDDDDDVDLSRCHDDSFL